MECFFDCGKHCAGPGVDWYCISCQTSYHYACNERQSPVEYTCVNCNVPFNNTTVAYWATATRATGISRIGFTLDVNYIRHGIIVAVQPYFVLPSGEFKRNPAFIACNIGDLERRQTRKDWYRITQMLDRVSVDGLYLFI
jgi:hypothetical protein